MFDADDVVLADSDNFAHIADVLDGAGGMTLGDLFDKGDDVSFSGAPDPSNFLAFTAVSDDELANGDRQRVKILTFNVGLLDAKLLGFIDYKATPLLNERRGRLPAMVFDTRADIILLQELWVADDVQRFAEAADEAGYLAFATDRSDYNDGLASYIRRDVVRNVGNVVDDEVEYTAQDGQEFFPGPGIKRGFQALRFTHVDVGDVLVANTHMQAFPAAWKERMQQSRELGQYLTDNRDDDTLVLVGGDLNAGPYYANEEWTMPDGTIETTWWKNTLSYPTMLEYGGLQDLAVMARPLETSDIDVTLGDTVVNDAAASTEIPGAEDGWCDATPHLAFTASDCNSLYFEQYAGTEYPARLDHLFGGGAEGRIKVDRSAIVFTDVNTFGDVESEPSDHYGVLAELLVLPSWRMADTNDDDDNNDPDNLEE